MKTSNRLIIALFVLGLSGLVCAQDSATESAISEEGIELAEDGLTEEGIELEDDVIDLAIEPDDEMFEADESAEADPEPFEETAVAEEPIEPADVPSDELAVVDESVDTETMPFAGEARTYGLLVHPIFTPDQADSVYRPLVDYLNARTAHNFELQTSRDFHRYWLEIRRGMTPDLVLEDAHLTALRIERYDYTPLVKASQPATFSLLTSGMNVDATLASFVAQPISSMPAPSLGYLILTSWFENPMQQPIIQSNASSWLDAVEIVFSMEAEAAIVPHNLVERYVNMEVVRTSEEFPHASISASSTVPMDVQEDIIQALSQLHDDSEYFSALHELDIDQFVPASVDEYRGLESWLNQVFSFF